MIDTLVECRVSYPPSHLLLFINSFLVLLDDLEDELTITALRMLVKDLSILFQAGNEGVANVLGTLPVNNHIHLPHLENYFETSHVDAKEALNTFTSKRNSSLNISAWPRSFKAYLTFPCLT